MWFKRDLRLTDHEPLKLAIEQSQAQHCRTLLLYIFEPMLIDDPHYSERHWRFVAESLTWMNENLAPYQTQVVIRHDDALNVFAEIIESHSVLEVFSHEEVGLAKTFKRDRECSACFTQYGIDWHESPTGAVVRGSPNRDNWDALWKQTMRAEPLDPDLSKLRSSPSKPVSDKLPEAWTTPGSRFQRGGRCAAERTARSFYEQRGKNYHWQISKPLESRTSCSRMSAYLAWGCMSLKEFYQMLLSHWGQQGWRRALSALSSRLHWHCHFIQKFESECAMEFKPVNSAYESLDSDLAMKETATSTPGSAAKPVCP